MFTFPLPSFTRLFSTVATAPSLTLAPIVPPKPQVPLYVPPKPQTTPAVSAPSRNMLLDDELNANRITLEGRLSCIVSISAN